MNYDHDIWIIETLPDESVSEVSSQRAMNSITDSLWWEFSGLNGETSEF